MDLDLHPKILLKERANIPDTTALLDYKYVQTTLETMYYSITFMIQMKKGATASQCLQITEKVSFNIASEASCVYILSGHKFIKMPKIVHFGEFLKNYKSLRSDSVTRQDNYNRTKIGGKLKNSDETF